MEAFQQQVLSERTVFLSYSHRNRRAAARLEEELEARNVRVYRDVTSLQPGEDWQAALERAVRSADCVMVLISPAAAASDPVRQEVNWAMGELGPGGLVERIVPLMMLDGAQLTNALQHYVKNSRPLKRNLQTSSNNPYGE